MLIWKSEPNGVHNQAVATWATACSVSKSHTKQSHTGAHGKQGQPAHKRLRGAVAVKKAEIGSRIAHWLAHVQVCRQLSHTCVRSGSTEEPVDVYGEQAQLFTKYEWAWAALGIMHSTRIGAQ